MWEMEWDWDGMGSTWAERYEGLGGAGTEGSGRAGIPPKSGGGFFLAYLCVTPSSVQDLEKNKISKAQLANPKISNSQLANPKLSNLN